MPTLRTLNVWPNPYQSVDHEGRPNHVLSTEPTGDGVKTFDSRSFVGARVKATVLEKFKDGDARQMVQDTEFEYDSEPTKVLDTLYYRQAVARGDLVAADEETAKRLKTKFEDPAKVLTRARDGAVERLKGPHKHEDHDDDFTDKLVKHAFGPMVDTSKTKEAVTTKVQVSDVMAAVKATKTKGGE